MELLEFASQLHSEEREEEGLIAIDIYLREGHYNPEGWSLKAEICYSQDKFEEGLLAAAQALKLAPDHYPALLARLSLLDKLERYPEILELTSIIDQTVQDHYVKLMELKIRAHSMLGHIQELVDLAHDLYRESMQN